MLERLLARAAAVLSLLGAPAMATAGDLELTPILVELTTASRTALLSLRNAGASSMRYQVRAYGWTQQADGAMELAPSRELVLFPPLLELAPGESRNLRVGTEAPPAALERSWRIVVEELPVADTKQSTRVQVLTRVGIPVFLAPSRRSAAGEIAFLPAPPRRLRFTVRNTGTVRLRPSAVTLTVNGAGGEPLLARSLDPWYVLAGGERVYEVEVPEGACARAAETVATAALDSGPLEARASGACRGE
jgi:fimbrial chaperone protein